MQALSSAQTEQAAGGILSRPPATVPLADSAGLGSLGFAFGAGYGAATYVYNTWLNY